MIQALRKRLSGHGTFVRFGFASTLLGVVGMLCGIVIIRWMPPEELGLWQSVLIVQTYALILQAGIITGLSRELPFFQGRQEGEKAEALAASAQSVALLGAGVLVLAGVFTPLLVEEFQVRMTLLVVFCSSGLTLYQNYLGTTFRANRAFEHLARIQLADMVVQLATLPLVYLYGYWGLVVRFVILVLISTILRHFFRPMKVPLRLRKSDLLHLFKVGAPMFGFGYLLQTVDTFPRLLLLTSGDAGVLLVGLFAPASAIFGLMRILPRSIGSYVFPQMNYKLGATQDASRLWPIAWKASVYFLLAAVPFVLIGMLVFPWLIRSFFANYVEAIPAVGWALVAGAFMGTRVAINVLYTLKAYGWLSVYTALNLGSAWLVPTLLLPQMPPLVAVTMGFALSRMGMFVIGLFCIRRATGVRA